MLTDVTYQQTEETINISHFQESISLSSGPKSRIIYLSKCNVSK